MNHPGSSRGAAQPRSGIQAKLAIHQPGDEYELEADRVADRAAGASSAASASIARATAVAPAPSPAAIAEAEAVAGHSGRPLPPSLIGHFAPRLGRDLGDVRIHTDVRAARAAEAIDAAAYTIGRHIAFGAGRYAPETASGRHLIAHELAHVTQQLSGVGRRLQRQYAVRPAGGRVGHFLAPPATSSDNIREDILVVMDRLQYLGVLTAADHATDHAAVSAAAPASVVPETAFKATIAAIRTNEMAWFLTPTLADKLLAMTITSGVGATQTDGVDDVRIIQTRLHALGMLSDADYASESAKLPASGTVSLGSMIATTLAMGTLRIQFVSGALGWQPIRTGDAAHPDDSLLGGDRFGGQTFTKSVSVLYFDRDVDADEKSAIAAGKRSRTFSIFVPAGVSRSIAAGTAASTTRKIKVAVFFSPGGVAGNSPLNATLMHGLRGGADPSDFVLISVPGMSSATNGDGWVSVDNQAITDCLTQAGLPVTLDVVRLISHSRGAEGLKATLQNKTLTAAVDKIIVLDESTTFGGSSAKGIAGNLAPYIKGAAPTAAGGPGITLAPGGASSYRAVAMPLGGTTQALSIAPDCARAIGFSRVILDAAAQRADVAAALAGSTAAASPSAPDWSSIKGQLLPLPPRGQLISGPAPAAGGPPYNINDYCSSPTKGGFPSKVSTITANVTAGQAELAKASAANSWAAIKWKPAAENSLLVFCCFFELGIDGYFFHKGKAGRSDTLSVDAHHYFVAEIAGELFK